MSRIDPAMDFNATSFPDCHWKLCRRFMDRYQSVLPAEQLYALAHIFANTQLLLRGNADQAMALVLDLVRDQLPTEVDQVENKSCWERPAEPEFPARPEIGDISTKDADAKPSASEPKYNPIRPSTFDSIPKQIVPSREPVTLDSIYQNLILFDNFFKTRTYYNLLGCCGQLELTVKSSADDVTCATIHVAHLNLSQASANGSSAAIQLAVKRFMLAMKDRCYTVETLDPKNAFKRGTNIVQRVPLNDAQMKCSRPLIGIDRAHYALIMHNFYVRDNQGDNGCHLVFSADFTNSECNLLQGIAEVMKLPGRIFDLPDAVDRKRFLVLARELPPQDIVRRIVTEKDTELGFQYRVTPPQRNREKETVAVKAEKPAIAVETLSMPMKSEVKKKTVKSELLAETLADLTKFAPIKTLRTVNDVYRNLVLIGTNWNDTAYHFNNTNVGMLELWDKQNLVDGVPCGFTATVKVGKFLLAEARANGKKSARSAATVAFFKKAKMYCYQINKKQSARTEISVVKQDDRDADHYKRLIEDFSEDCLGKELVFGVDFSEEDRRKFAKIAKDLRLKTSRSAQIKNHRLKIFGQKLPALAILERIVLANDAKLSAIYEVIPPRMGERSGSGVSPSMG